MIAVLSGYLAENLRSADVRLEHASNEIAKLQAFNEDVIESLTSGLVTTDRDGRIITFNRAAVHITGYDAVAVLGRSVAEVLQLPPAFVASME